MDFCETSVSALESRVNIESTLSLAVREQIGRYKYTENDALKPAYEQIVSALNEQVNALIAKEEG